jgi:hypothetical protein
MAISFRTITYPFRDFFRRVHNVYRWLPTLWNDRDYDDSYITEILIKKLEFTRDFYLSGKAYSAEAEKVADEIKEAIDRLHMTRDSWEFYEDLAMEQLEQKWGKTTFNFVPFQHTEDGSVLTYEMKSKTEKVGSDEEEEQYRIEFGKALDKARKQYMKDKVKAYEFIAKNIDKWWD